MQSVVLNLDDSVGALDRSVVIPLLHWGETLRLACRLRLLREFGTELDKMLPDDSGTVFIGSGDFHHVSLPLIDWVSARRGPLEVVVFDNHPDNLRFYPFGIHCGSWVGHAAKLSRVTHVHIVGITSPDVGRAYAWDMQLRPLLRRSLTFWSIGADVSWARSLGLSGSFRNFYSIGEMLRAFFRHMAKSSEPVYLSVDKDVLSVQDVHTNWDQGCMSEDELCHAIDQLRGRVVGSDVTGEVSVAEYSQRWKRKVASNDPQPTVPAEQLPTWRSQHHALNGRLLEAIEDTYAKLDYSGWHKDRLLGVVT